MISLNITSANAIGNANDIPVALHGYLTIKERGSIHIETCTITLSGRTNQRTEPATFTAIDYQGTSDCGNKKMFENMEPWTMTWTGGDPFTVIFENVTLSPYSENNCNGKMVAKRRPEYPGQIMISNQTLGKCTIDGVLNLVPGSLNFAPPN